MKLLSVTLVLACLCAACPPARVDSPSGGGPWLTSAPQPASLRKLTAVIVASPPAALRSTIERVADRIDDERVSDLLRVAISDSGGSGSILVYAGGKTGTPRGLVVTNRHVVEAAEDVTVTFDDGRSYAHCPVLYTDPTVDLAVIGFAGEESPVRFGLALGGGVAVEREHVVAAGFPDRGGKQIYRETEGSISNAKFPSGMGPLIEHTAPLDPGSSGGPLTTDAGELLGVNTMLLADRHASFFAIPASAVSTAVLSGLEHEQSRKLRQWNVAQIMTACQHVIDELGSQQPELAILNEHIANRLVAEHGWQSFLYAASDPRLVAFFAHDPMAGLRMSVLMRIARQVEVGRRFPNGIGCQLNHSDVDALPDAETVRASVRLMNGHMELTWIFEHGHWRIADSTLARDRDEEDE